MSTDHDGLPQWTQIDSFLPWAGGDYRPIAVLDLEPDQLNARVGIIFADDQDDLDQFKWAGLRLATGEQILLTRHLRNPGTGTQVDSDLHSDAAMVLDHLLAATGLSMANIKWRAPSQGSN